MFVARKPPKRLTKVKNGNRSGPCSVIMACPYAWTIHDRPENILPTAAMAIGAAAVATVPFYGPSMASQGLAGLRARGCRPHACWIGPDAPLPKSRGRSPFVRSAAVERPISSMMISSDRHAHPRAEHGVLDYTDSNRQRFISEVSLCHTRSRSGCFAIGRQTLSAKAAWRAALVSAMLAPRSPIGRSGPVVVSRAVCRSASAFISAPRSTA